MRNQGELLRIGVETGVERMANSTAGVSLATRAEGLFSSNVIAEALLLELAVSFVVGLRASAAVGPTPRFEAGSVAQLTNHAP